SVDQCPLSIQLQPATAEINAVGWSRGSGPAEHLGVETIDDVFAVFAMPDETGLAQNTQVVRDIGQFLLESGSQLAHVLRSCPKACHDPQPLGVCECLQESGTDLRVKRVLHNEYSGS